MLFWNLLWQWQNFFFLGLYPVGKTANKTSLPFWRALTAVSRSGFKIISLPGRQVQIFYQHVLVKLHHSRGTFCQKLTNQNFAATGSRRNGKKGGLCSRRSLIPSPQSPIFSRVLAPLPLPSLRLLRRLQYMQYFIGNLVPRAFSSFKMAVGETPGQGRLLKYSKNRVVFCHVTHDEMAFSKGSFQRLAALFIFCNRKPWSKRNEVISSCLRDAILKNFWSHFSSLGQLFLRPPFWTRRRPWRRGCFIGVRIHRIREQWERTAMMKSSLPQKVRKFEPWEGRVGKS